MLPHNGSMLRHAHVLSERAKPVFQDVPTYVIAHLELGDALSNCFDTTR